MKLDERYIQGLWTRYHEIDDEIKRLSIKRSAIGDEIAVLACPHKTGDVLVRDKTIRKRSSDWSRSTISKKTIPERARVSRIRFNGHKQDPYDVYGIRIKKDGSDGDEIGLYEWDNWKREES